MKVHTYIYDVFYFIRNEPNLLAIVTFKSKIEYDRYIYI